MLKDEIRQELNYLFNNLDVYKTLIETMIEEEIFDLILLNSFVEFCTRTLNALENMDFDTTEYINKIEEYHKFNQHIMDKYLKKKEEENAKDK